MSYSIRLAHSVSDFSAAKQLIARYVQWLNIDLSFQDYENEIQNLEAKYRPPAAAMFIARMQNGKHVECGGIVSLDRDGICEVKRLFVGQEARGLGIGRALMGAIIARACASGYREMVLDTLPTMEGALRLYASVGFERTSPYYDNPVPGAMFFRRSLSQAGGNLPPTPVEPLRKGTTRP